MAKQHKAIQIYAIAYPTSARDYTVSIGHVHCCNVSPRDVGSGPLIVSGGPLDGKAFSALSDFESALTAAIATPTGG
jgi:hypothetical protein